MVCVQLHTPEIKFNFVDFSFRIVTNKMITDGVSLRSLTQNEGIILGNNRHGGPGSVVGIATGYGLDGPGIESRLGARFSTPVQTGPGAHPASCTMGTGSFPGVKSGRGLTLTPHPF